MNTLHLCYRSTKSVWEKLVNPIKLMKIKWNKTYKRKEENEIIKDTTKKQ